MSRWTRADVQRVRAKALQAPKPSKYKNRKTTIDGIVFDSAKEARRWQELKMLEAAGQIARLKRQQKFELITTPTSLRGDVRYNGWVNCVGHYVADFVYDELSPAVTQFVVEDVKGIRTSLYQWKKRHFEAQYGVKIRET